MNHQDWNHITFKNTNTNTKIQETKKEKQFLDKDNIKIEQTSNLGQLILQARNTKKLNQKELAFQLGVSSQVLNRWETNKEILTNAQIALIEKKTGIKLPRNKKTEIKE